jgi:HK97 family phage major capsid protein
MSNEIQEKLDQALSGIKSVQDVADHCNGRIDALANETIKKTNEDVTKALEDIQEIQAKNKALDEQTKRIETLMCNMSAKTVDTVKEQEKKARDSFTKYLRKGTAMDNESVEYIIGDMVEKAFIGIDEDKKEMFRKDLQVGVDPDGGYFVRPEISDKMITRVFESSPVRQYASVVTINSDSLEMLIDDDEADSGGWVGETESRPVTGTPQIGKILIYAHEQYANPRATQKMLDDAGFDIEAWLQDKVNRKFTRIENNAFVVGDGNKKPRGFLDYPAWTTPGTYERHKLEQIVSGTSATFDADDLKNLKNAQIEDYQPNSIWMMRRETFGTVELLKDTQGRYLLDPNSVKVGDTQILLGKQVVFMHDFPLEASNALAVAYGDLGIAYTVVDRIGIRVIRDNLTEKPYTLFYTTKRTGGDVTNYQALKILKCAP